MVRMQPKQKVDQIIVLSLQLLGNFPIPGWQLNQTAGTLTTETLVKEDAGTFTCMAENNAGRIEASIALVVILKPKVEELENGTYPTGGKARLTCKASGDPLPNISWRKISNK